MQSEALRGKGRHQGGVGVGVQQQQQQQQLLKEKGGIMGTGRPVHAGAKDDISLLGVEASMNPGLSPQVLIDIGHICLQAWNLQITENVWRSLYNEGCQLEFPLNHMLPGGHDVLTGFEGIKLLLKSWHTTLAPFRVTGQIVEGPKKNQVMMKFNVNGIFSHDFGDKFKANNNYIDIEGVDILTFDQNCKIIREQCILDTERLLRLLKGELVIERPYNIGMMENVTGKLF